MKITAEGHTVIDRKTYPEAQDSRQVNRPMEQNRGFRNRKMRGTYSVFYKDDCGALAGG